MTIRGSRARGSITKIGARAASWSAGLPGQYLLSAFGHVAGASYEGAADDVAQGDGGALRTEAPQA